MSFFSLAFSGLGGGHIVNDVPPPPTTPVPEADHAFGSAEFPRQFFDSFLGFFFFPLFFVFVLAWITHFHLLFFF